jgi:hypothetical protein
MEAEIVVIGAVSGGLLVLEPTMADSCPPARYNDIKGAESRQVPVSEAGQ